MPRCALCHDDLAPGSEHSGEGCGERPTRQARRSVLQSCCLVLAITFVVLAALVVVWSVARDRAIARVCTLDATRLRADGEAAFALTCGASRELTPAEVASLPYFAQVDPSHVDVWEDGVHVWFPVLPGAEPTGVFVPAPGRSTRRYDDSLVDARRADDINTYARLGPGVYLHHARRRGGTAPPRWYLWDR